MNGAAPPAAAAAPAPAKTPASDPRVFFAAERTLLAWLRTGLTIIGIGFVVSRFGLFVDLVAASQSHANAGRGGSIVSGALGVAFVLIGAASVAVAALQHGRFIETLPEIDRPAAYSRHWALWLAGLVAAAGFVLAAYLGLTLG